MENDTVIEWYFGEDMPHLEYMDENGLTREYFSNSTQLKLSLFDKELDHALSDGITSDEEYADLHAHSGQLRDLMQKEVAEKKAQQRKLDSEDVALIGIFAAIGASIGLGKLFRS